MRRALRADVLLAGSALALALATALRRPAAWESGNALNHVSGVWMTLADDLARGTFYRPLHGDGGYGGTRYFPLAFALQGALVRMGAPLLAAGYAASLAAGLLLAAGTFLLLRSLGVAAGRAAAFAPLALAGFAGQHALAAARGDLLPVALSALALALVARRGPRRPRIFLAAVALALAFAAKPTALTAAAAAVASLTLRRARNAALTLAALVFALAVAAVAAIDALSAGRFLSGLREVATAGASARTALAAPLRLGEQLALGDPAGLALVLAAAAALAASLRPLRRAIRGGIDDPRLVPALWFAAAWAGALAVLATPGTGVNHLVELEAASAALLGASAGAPGRAGRFARAGAPAAAVAGLAVALALWRTDASSSRLAELRGVVRALPRGAPVLSEDPLVPLIAGERPFLLDPFTIRITAARAPELCAPLAEALRRGAFPAVVLFEDLASPVADRWYAEGNLGLPLAEEIRRGYRRASAIGRYQVYVPRAPEAVGAGVVRRDGPG